MDFLKSILSEKQIKQISEALGDKYAEVNSLTKDLKLDLSEGNMIPKAKFDSVNEELKSSKALVVERDKQLTALGEQAKDSETLKATIKSLQEANAKAKEEYDASLLARDKDFALSKLFEANHVRNAKTIKPLLDLEKAIYKDGEFIGLSEQIEALKKSDSYLFDDADAGNPVIGGKGVDQQGKDLTLEDLRKL